MVAPFLRLSDKLEILLRIAKMELTYETRFRN